MFDYKFTLIYGKDPDQVSKLLENDDAALDYAKLLGDANRVSVKVELQDGRIFVYS